jgi:glycosyltransferase involved in cell wall biosynthesis
MTIQNCSETPGKNHKGRVLFVPDRLEWALGTLSFQYAEHLHDYDHAVFPGEQAEQSPESFLDVLRSTDIVHWMHERYYERCSQRNDEIWRVCQGKVNVVSLHHLKGELVGHEPWRMADLVVTGSKKWTDALASAGISPERLDELGHGVYADQFKPFDVPTRESVRKQFGIDVDAPVIGFFAQEPHKEIGRKGEDVLLEALKLVRDGGFRPTLVICGLGWTNLVQEIQSLGIRVIRQIASSHSEMPKIYNLLDLFLVTARKEGGPLTVLESMSCGVPVVATRVGLVPEVVRDGWNGMSLPIEDHAGIAREVMRLLEDPKRRCALGKRARETIMSTRQLEKVLSRLPHMYEQATRNWDARTRSSRSVSCDHADVAVRNMEKDVWEYWASHQVQKRLERSSYLLWVKRLLAASCPREARKVLWRAVPKHWRETKLWMSLVRSYIGDSNASCICRIRDFLMRALVFWK